MSKPNNVSVSLYMLDGRLQVIAQFGLENAIFEKDEHGYMKDDKRKAFVKALEEAISNWDLG